MQRGLLNFFLYSLFPNLTAVASKLETDIGYLEQKETYWKDSGVKRINRSLEPFCRQAGAKGILRVAEVGVPRSRAYVGIIVQMTYKGKGRQSCKGVRETG